MTTRKALFIIVILLGTILSVQAGQTGKIAGTITDARTGEPLPGVNVVISELEMGASTDAQGYY
jgi:hypothetical protein